MATFSVDVTDVSFAGGRTGYKDVYISNMPSGGIVAVFNRSGDNAYFRVRNIETGHYKIETPTRNDTGTTKSTYIRFTNNDDASDYVQVDLRQYSVTDMTLYIDGASYVGYGEYTKNVGSDTGYFSVYVDVAQGQGASGSVITSGADWLGVTMGYPAVTDTGFVYYNVTYIINTDNDRSGQVEFANSTYGWTNIVTVVQAGDAPTEVLSVTPSVLNYDATGGSKSIAVQYRGNSYNCDTTDVDSWVTVSLSSVMTGVLSGTVVAAPNRSASQRSGNVVFSDASGSINLPITQLGQAVTLSVSPSSLSYTSGGGTKTLAVGYDGVLTTNASSMPSWLTSSYVTVDSSHRTYTISADENNTTVARSFDFIFADNNMSVEVPISQAAGAAPAPALSLSPADYTATESSGQVRIDILNTNLSVNDVIYSPSANWLTFAGKGTSYIGNFPYFVFNYSANSSSDVRTGTIGFSAPGFTSSTFTIQQQGSDVHQIVSSPLTTTVNYGSGRVTIQVSPNLENLTYTISGGDWIRYSSSSSSGEIKYYTFEYDANYESSSRECTITFSAPDYESAVTTITQNGVPGDLISFSVNKLEFNYLGGYGTRSDNLRIRRNGYNGTVYTRYTGDSIPVVFNGGNPIVSSADYVRTYLPTNSRNDSYTDLEGKLEFYTAETGGYKIGELPVVWYGTPKSLTVWPNVLAFIGSSIVAYRELYMYVSSPAEVTITVSNDTPFTLALEEECETYKKFRVRCKTNDAAEGYLIFSSNGDTYPVYFKVATAVSPDPFTFPLSGGSKYMMISSNAEGSSPSFYTYPDWVDWHSYDYASHTPISVGNTDWYTRYGLYYVTVSPTSSSRSSTIEYQYVSGSGNRYGTFTISQDNGVLGVSPNVMNFSSNGGSDTATITYSGNLTFNEESLPYWISVSEVSTSSGQSVYNVNVLRNSGDQRSVNIIFSDDSGKLLALPVIQEVGAPSIAVSPSSSVVSEGSGTVSVSVYGPQNIQHIITGNWLSFVAHIGSTYTFAYTENTTSSSRNATVTFYADGYLPATYRVVQAAGSSIKANPEKLKFHKYAATKKISFSNVPSALVDYSITYIDGYDWLTVSGNGLSKDISVVDNSGIRRRAEIRFSDHNNSSNFVVVQVIQGGDGYDSIWMDTLYYPENRDVDGNYYYRIVDANTNEEYFRGIAAKPEGWGGNIGGIDVPRLVEDHLYSEFPSSNALTVWSDMKGYNTVELYNMTTAGYPGMLAETFKYWNDWSGYEEMYDYTVCLNDPINSKGCDNMIIPFCVYYDDTAIFRIVSTGRNGVVQSSTMPTPANPFVMTYGSFNYLDTLEFKQDNDVIFSYDMKHCGDGAFIYRNRFGGWDSFLIEGNISKTDEYNKQNYRMKGEYNSIYSVNSLHHFDEKYTDSIDINTKFEAYTGWLTDEEAERLAFHLLSSPIVYFQNFNGDLYDSDPYTMVPVRLTSSSAEYKKFRNGRRLVNYLITFESCNIPKVRN